MSWEVLTKIQGQKCVTSCLMVSCMTFSQSAMMLSVSYCIKYSQPWRVFSCTNRQHQMCGYYGNNDKGQCEQEQKVHLQNILLWGFVFGGPGNWRSSQVFCEFWNNLGCFSLKDKMILSSPSSQLMMKMIFSLHCWALKLWLSNGGSPSITKVTTWLLFSWRQRKN